MAWDTRECLLLAFYCMIPFDLFLRGQSSCIAVFPGWADCQSVGTSWLNKKLAAIWNVQQVQSSGTRHTDQTAASNLVMFLRHDLEYHQDNAAFSRYDVRAVFNTQIFKLVYTELVYPSPVSAMFPTRGLSSLR